MSFRILSFTASATLATVLALGGPVRAQTPAPAKPADPTSCSDAKDCLQKGAVAHRNKNFPLAVKFLPTGCDIEPKACNIAGEILRKGEGVPKDATKAASLHGRACDKGLVISCAIEAQLRYHGDEGLAPDKGRARIAFEKSCSPDFLDSCVNAGVMYSGGEGGAVDKDKARTLYQKGCDGGEQTGCVNVAAMYLNGEGGPADKPKAETLFSQGCEKKNALACFNLGLIYAKGLNGPIDFPKALPFLQSGCDGGNQESCKVAQQLRDDQAQKAAAAAAPQKPAKGKKK
jgi:TPR repeat protein